MSGVHVLTTAEANGGLLHAIRELLDHAFAGDFSPEDWQHTIGGFHAVARDGDAVVAHAAVVPRTLEIDGRPVRAGYVEGVATAPERQGQGLGSVVMRALEDVLRREFEMGALSTDRPDFYGRLGWRRWKGPTFVRHGQEIIRTEDEDDGIMVFLFGPSEHLDLSAAITCETRPGDDW